MFNSKVIKVVILLAVSILGCYAAIVLADSSADNIGVIANRITGTFSNLAKLITAAAYVAGAGLTVTALFKFKQHKDNPQQVQLGTCVTILLIGVTLIFLPSIITVGGSTLYGSAKSANIGGTDVVQTGG